MGRGSDPEHALLPTTILMLASFSGFSGSALVEVEATPNVHAYVIRRSSASHVSGDKLWHVTVKVVPVRTVVTVRHGGQDKDVHLAPDAPIGIGDAGHEEAAAVARRLWERADVEESVLSAGAKSGSLIEQEVVWPNADAKMT